MKCRQCGASEYAHSHPFDPVVIPEWCRCAADKWSEWEAGDIPKACSKYVPPKMFGDKGEISLPHGEDCLSCCHGPKCHASSAQA